jgi:hypothetical protein
VSVTICATCGVEHTRRPDVCAICSDERQWVPADGQRWTTLAELEAAGARIDVEELEPDLMGVHSSPTVGIGQVSQLVVTPAGNVLWDPVGFVDGDGVRAVRAHGPVAAIAASHPHMFGVQVEWSRALDDAPVLVAEQDLGWVARPDPVIKPWSGVHEPVPGVTLSQPGGHFPGSAVLHWAGRDGRGVLLASDTLQVNPDRVSVAFMRSYPNRIPLSAAAVQRIAAHVEGFDFDRIYSNFGRAILSGAREAVRRSADRHAAWVRGDFDHLT